MGVVVLGLAEFEAALGRHVIEADKAASAAVLTGGHYIEAEVKKELSRNSHAKGTPTPSDPGQPPALVSGQLRRGVRVMRPNRGANGLWATEIGPTTVQGRIQELGGATGRGHASVLPPRPYLEPTVRRLVGGGQLHAICYEAWAAAVGGV